MRMLFINFNSAFNTVIPQHPVNKIKKSKSSLCKWLLNFLTNRPQTVRAGKKSSEMSIMNAGVPKRCVLSLLLFTLMTHDCCARQSSNHIIKFGDDTTVVGIMGAIESLLTGSLSVWYCSCPAADKKALQRVVRAAEKITRSAQPSIQDLCPSRCHKRATSTLIKDASHSAHKLVTLLPFGKRYRSMRLQEYQTQQQIFATGHQTP